MPRVGSVPTPPRGGGVEGLITGKQSQLRGLWGLSGEKEFNPGILRLLGDFHEANPSRIYVFTC